MQDYFKEIKKYIEKHTKAKSVNTTVGVHEEDSNRKDSEITNSQNLATHAFGSLIQNIPKRDPIIDPITNKMDEISEMTSSLIANNIQNDTQDFKDIIIDIANKIGLFASVDIVRQQFLTGGNGQWKALSKRTINKKGNDTILIDTKQLLNSIKHKVNS